MCQMISDANQMLFSFGFVNRNHKVVITYSRSKLARTKSATALKVSSIADCITETDMNNENSQQNAQQNSQMECRWGRQCDNNMISMTSLKCTLSNQMPKSISDKSINGYKLLPDQHIWHHNSQQIQSSTPAFSKRDKCTNRIHSIKSKMHRIIRATKVSDYLFVLIFLTILTTHSVFGKPLPTMSLETELQSPCHGDNSDKQELTRANVKSILNMIDLGTSVAKDASVPHIVNYITILHDSNSTQNNIDPKTKELEVFESPAPKLKEYHDTWSTHSMNWLYPSNKGLDKEFLGNISIEMRANYSKSGHNFDLNVIISLLQDCDERFQLLLTGLHHILNSHENQLNTMRFNKYMALHQYFSEIKKNIKMVLCEIRTALIKLGASSPVIIDTKTIKSSKEDNENTSFYEWIVFREYLNQLEHLHQVVGAINETIDASSSNTNNEIQLNPMFR